MNKPFFSNFLLLFLGIFLLTALQPAHSQNIDQVDFSSIKVDELSDQQIRQFLERAETTGMSEQELEAEALNRGMPYSEVRKLRTRIAMLEEDDKELTEVDQGERRRVSDAQHLSQKGETLQQKAPGDLEIFGYQLFRRQNLSFEPSLNIPTPKNYTLGPGDQLLIDIWGASQQSYELTVSPEGQVQISNLGPIQVSGLTIEEASELIKRRLGSIYSGLRGSQPSTFAQVSLGNVRSINVTIAGDAYMQGTYTLPAFATAFNALYLAGGPSAKGSFRDIRIMRQGQEVAQLDLYDFLLKGETQHNIRLRDEDIIFIESHKSRVTLAGEVIRPAIYELKQNETLTQLIQYAGGFSASAFTKHLQVDRKTESQRKILNVDQELFSSFLMQPGDEIEVGEILDLYENRVRIRGAVYREGDFALQQGMQLTQLVKMAEGVREDAFLQRVALYRLKDNLEIEVIDLNLYEIMQGDAPDFNLQKEDLLRISSVLEMQEERTVRIIGEVQQPGSFQWAHGLSLGEVIRKADGLKDAASLARVEIARRVSDRTATSTGQATTEVFSFSLDENLDMEDEAAAFLLHPFDMIFVRRSPGYQTQQLAQIRGEVNFPGSYAITRKNESVANLVQRAGGLTQEAYLPGATLLRQTDADRAERIRRLQALETGQMQIITDTLEQTDKHYIGIDLEHILENPGSQHDLILKEGDILEIPRQMQTVRMTGAVLHPTSAPYQPRQGVRSYISQAGGFADNARKRNIYVVYPNGMVDRTRSFMGIRSYPTVKPGSEIIVPQKPEREPRTLQETIAISSAVSSLALVIVTLINQF